MNDKQGAPDQEAARMRQELALAQAEVRKMQAQWREAIAAANDSNKQLQAALASAGEASRQWAGLKDQLAAEVQATAAGQTQVSDILRSVKAMAPEIQSLDASMQAQRAKLEQIVKLADEAKVKAAAAQEAWEKPGLQFQASQGQEAGVRADVAPSRQAAPVRAQSQ